MADYRAPRRDMKFVLEDLLESEQHYASLEGCEPLTPDLLEAILDGAQKFSEEVLAPLNDSGDQEGCRFENGQVKTPRGFKQAFEDYVAQDWQGLSVPVEEGGQGLPASLGIYVNEMVGSANWAWSMYPGLAQAPITCLLASGSEEQKKTYLPKLLSGEWAGTMCLSEAHAGSDVGLLTTKAVFRGDGTYAITGSKIFISGGEQDLTENIVHTVLARVEGAPAGTRGISLFVVPKRLVAEDGSLSDANGVACASIERKMGIKGSATCVMSFAGAIGTLLGEENGGLEQMFKMMNAARVGTALQGISMGELAYQKSLAYARERLQMRSFTGVKNPDGEADPIIVHPDIRRMLLVQKALAEGNRAFLYWLAHQVDKARYGEGETAQAADDLLGLLTPIAKAFCTETCIESTNLGMQVLGGHGYVSDNGLEQIVRDARVSAIYEGTTGIQALDLLGRKVLGTGGKLLSSFTEQIQAFCEELSGEPDLAAFREALETHAEEWNQLTAGVTERVMKSADEIGAASVDYIMYAGYVTLGYLWARMAKVARQKLAAGASGADADFYRAKLFTARFYFERILPRTRALATSMSSGAGNLMELEAEHFCF
jgi:alkylation response protein AidB-like acyl-CoA dehydrogenase